MYSSEKSKSPAPYYYIYILSMLIFGTNGILVSHISIESSQIVLTRTLLGGLMLSLLVLLRGGFDRDAVKAERKALLGGGVALGLNWVALFTAYRLLNVSLATLIYYAGPRGITIAAVVIVAVGLVCISGSIASSGLSLAGLFAAAVAALFYAALIVFNKRITRTSGLQTAAIELDIAFVVVLIYTLLTVGLPHPTPADIPWLLTLGLVNTGLAYLLYFTGLQKLPAQSVALISYVDPVSALVFSALILHESLTPTQLLGAVLIIGGAILGELRKA